MYFLPYGYPLGQPLMGGSRSGRPTNKFYHMNPFLNDSSFLVSINTEQVSSFLTYADVYYNLNIYYLAIVNVLIFLFSYAYAKLIFSLNN